MATNILVINGSLGGAHGNTAKCIAPLVSKLKAVGAEIKFHHLKDGFEISSLTEDLKWANGFVFTSGTYWDSWGSPLQKFLEEATDLESSDIWIGKPAACFVTMHSVGGKEVLSRLQGVLSTLGLMIPPMSGMIYSLANHLALKTSDDADFWRLDDLEILATNLIHATKLPRTEWKKWPVDEGDAKRIWS